MAFDTIDEMERRISGVTEPHIVKNEKLSLGSEERGVGDAGALQVGLRFLSNAARVTVVRLARDWIDDGANER